MERKEEMGVGVPPPNYPAGAMARMASDPHDDTAECLGGLAFGTLVGYFSGLRGGPEPVFSGGGVGRLMRTKRNRAQ